MTQLPLGGPISSWLSSMSWLRSHAWLVYRLAKHDEGSGSYFIGLPVTYSALFFPLTYLVFQLLAPGLYAWVWLGLSLLLTFLFVYNCRIPKPNKLAIWPLRSSLITSLIGWGSPAWLNLSRRSTSQVLEPEQRIQGGAVR